MERRLVAFVAAAQDGDFASLFLEGAREHFHNGCFSSAADREVSNADHLTAKRVVAENTERIQAEPELHNRGVYPRKLFQRPAEKGGESTLPTVLDDCQQVRFQFFKPFS
jgi:hypothetical protein